VNCAAADQRLRYQLCMKKTPPLLTQDMQRVDPAMVPADAAAPCANAMKVRTV
jgi:hypothetical protein